MRSISVSESRKEMGDLVSEVCFTKNRVVISRHGKPVAVLVPVEDAELLVDLEDRIDLEAARQALKDPKRISWEKVKKELGL